MPDVQATTATDSPSGRDGTSPGSQPKPSGAADQASTQDAQLAELQKFADAYADKKHSKLDKTVANLTKERDSIRQQLDELTTKFGELSQSNFNQKKAEALEAARLDGDPAKLKAVQEHFQAIEDTEKARQTLAELNAEIEANKELLERFSEAGKLAKAKELEESSGVSAELILKLFDEQELTDVEQMESLAETLKGHVVKPGGQKAPEKLPHPDRITGGIGGKSVDDMSPNEIIRYGLERGNK
jgi:uncharacterized coiled-coil protein SlyX